MSIKEDTPIKYIENTTWLKTLDLYPKTTDDMKLLVSVVDRMGIFRKYDIISVSDMDASRLDILYAILRITNKKYNRVLEYVVNNIFCSNLKKILLKQTNLNTYELMVDQLMQDIDFFVCSTIKTNFPEILKQSVVKSNFIKYLRNTFNNNTFYKDLFGKKSFITNDKFYDSNDKFFDFVIKQFISYITKNLTYLYRTMEKYIEKIFDPTTSVASIGVILTNLEKTNNLNMLFESECMELEIYCDQQIEGMIDDEDEISEHKDLNFSLESLQKTNSIIKDFGYQIHYTENNSHPSTLSILQPFVDHRFAKSIDDLVKVLIHVMVNYQDESGIIDKSNNKTIKSYYLDLMKENTVKFMPINQLSKFIENTHIIPPELPYEIILRVLSTVLNIRIELLKNDMCLVEFDNSNNSHPNNQIMIYQANNYLYYTLKASRDSVFKPLCRENPPNIQKILSVMKPIKRKNHESVKDNSFVVDV
jgi:hypothetical protein